MGVLLVIQTFPFRGWRRKKGWGSQAAHMMEGYEGSDHGSPTKVTAQLTSYRRCRC